MSYEKKYFYANSMEVSTSTYDINLKFLRNIASDTQNVENAPPDRIDEIVVTMSPMHAKAMLSVLFTSIKSYEANHSKIPLNQEAEETYNKMIEDIKNL